MGGGGGGEGGTGGDGCSGEGGIGGAGGGLCEGEPKIYTPKREQVSLFVK